MKPTDEKELISFLLELGIKKEISIVSHEIDYYSPGRHDLPRPYSTGGIRYEETIIEGCKEIVEYILSTEDTENPLFYGITY